MKPFFSIIIPVYNTQEYITRCLDSCVNQTFKNIEIIVVDDCGKDDSIKIALNYTKTYPQIRIVHNPYNLGTFLSRIEGIKHAQGMFTLFLDSDDELKPNTCQEIYQSIQNDYKQDNQYTDIFNFGLEFIPQSRFKKIPAIISKTLINHAILETFFLKHSTPPWSLCTKAFKTLLLLQALDRFPQSIFSNTTQLTMAEDALLFFVIAMNAKKSIGINQVLYLYNQNLSSITQRSDTQAIEEKKQSLLYTIKILNQISVNKPQEKCKKRFINILESVIELESRYQNSFFAYPKACIKSLQYHQKWQTYLRILLFFISFGKIKL